MKAVTAEPEIVTRNGKPVSVILPIKKYEELRDLYHCVVKRFDSDNQLIEFSRKQFIATQLERNDYGVAFRARLVFAKKEVFAYGDLLEGRIIGRMTTVETRERTSK